MGEAEAELRRLLDIMAALRAPVGGCPWDVVQDFDSIAPYTIEEAYEVADAIARRDFAALPDELGDLLFQVVYHARMAEEEGRFGFAEVARAIADKMIRRHPHVFGEAAARDAGMQRAAWEEQKKAERAARAETGTLAGIPLGLPALVRAQKLTARAARVGFDWPDAAAVLEKLDEEVAELRAELGGADPARLKDEVGDLLFGTGEFGAQAGPRPGGVPAPCQSEVRTAVRGGGVRAGGGRPDAGGGVAGRDGSVVGGGEAGGTEMKVGVVGFGAWGKFHARGWGQVAGAELVGIVAHGDGSAAEAAAEFAGVAVHREIGALLRSGVEVVDIVAPNYVHADLVVAALEAGKHVVVEKPLATSGEGLARILAAEAASGRLVSVVHELRVSEQWELIRQEIAGGAVGVPMAGVYSLFRRPFGGGSGGWRHDPGRVGSWILEEPVHFIDLMLWYFSVHGEPVAVRATATPGVLGGNMAMTVRYASGAFFTVTQLLDGFEHHCSLDIAGTGGALRSWWSAGDARVTESDAGLSIRRAGAQAAETVRFGRSGEVFELVEHLKRSHAGFLAGVSPMPAAEAAKSVRVCLAAEEACRSGREVGLS